MSDARYLIRDGVVRLEQLGNVLIITLNRPESRNAVNTALTVALGEAVERLDSDPDLRVAVLTGAGTAFCAGQDLKDLAGGGSVLSEYRPEWGFGGFVRHFTSKPVIAAVNGFALGGGTEICLACDLVVASDSAFFGLPEVTRGLFAAGGGVPRIAQQIPPKIAARWALTGEHVPAREAARWGLVNEVVPAEDLMDTAIALARRIADNAPLAVQATKRLIHETVADSAWESAAWDAIESEIRTVFSSADAAEGTTAFAEKRTPIWRGR